MNMYMRISLTWRIKCNVYGIIYHIYECMKNLCINHDSRMHMTYTPNCTLSVFYLKLFLLFIFQYQFNLNWKNFQWNDIKCNRGKIASNSSLCTFYQFNVIYLFVAATTHSLTVHIDALGNTNWSLWAVQERILLQFIFPIECIHFTRHWIFMCFFYLERVTGMETIFQNFLKT